LNVERPTSNLERRNQDAPSHIVDRCGQCVVLKPLNDDCLLDGGLHPSIRLRLSRIRELPMTAVANLHGVERVAGQAFLIWDYVAGRTLEELSAVERAAIERDVRLIVETLHAHGIVHGALHARNIIVDGHGGVHLTHLSPLLHSDPAEDLVAIDAIFESARASRGDRAQRRPGPSPLNVRALVGATVALVLGLLIMISVIWVTS
jgi:hypothetical protein